MTGPAGPTPSYLVAGRYRLVRKIGQGGMGSVWLARDQLLDREVAVKQVLSTEGMGEAEALTNRQRAMREGRLAARLSHRNAIAMHDVALDGEDPWLVMEYLPSHSVADFLRDNGPISPVGAAQIAAQVADAIAEAHHVGIMHRDIKPANILIASSGRTDGLVKITDFGISRAKDDVSITQTGIVTGTPAYFAPEVARGDEPSDASDVYSLGATLYTMIEGTPPYGNSDSYIATLHRAASGQINPPVRAGALEPILLRLLEPSPANRPTMTDARDLLVQFAAGSLGTTDQVLSGRITTAQLVRSPEASDRTLSGEPTPSPRAATMIGNPQPASYPSGPRGYPSGPTYSSGPQLPGYQHQPMYQQPYQPPQRRSDTGIAVAVFLALVLLTALIAGIIIMTA